MARSDHEDPGVVIRDGIGIASSPEPGQTDMDMLKEEGEVTYALGSQFWCVIHTIAQCQDRCVNLDPPTI